LPPPRYSMTFQCRALYCQVLLTLSLFLLPSISKDANMAVEEIIPAILVIAVIFYAIRWLMGSSKYSHTITSVRAGPNIIVGGGINPDGSISGVTASMVCTGLTGLAGGMARGESDEVGRDHPGCVSGYPSCEYSLSSFQD
jgi:hypothetical protein